jgi:hypothetical protein
MGNSMEILQKLKIELASDPVIRFLGLYPKEGNTGYNKDTYTLMFIAALLTTAKLWKQSRCPTTDE